MRSLGLGFVALLLAGAAHAAETIDACKARHADLTTKAAAYQGETRIKRLIQADLDRATREMREGDAEECTEALDHATKLLAGEF